MNFDFIQDDLEPWRKKAACVGAPRDMFFKESKRSQAACINICDTCAVKGDCLTWVMEYESATEGTLRYGVWGGTTPAQRRQMNRRANPKPPLFVAAEDAV